MNPKTVWKSRFWCIASCALALLVLSGCVRLASAQGWRTADAKNAWNAFYTAFYYTDSGGRAYWYQSQAHGTHEIIWNFAEDIEMAIDHYTWSLTNDSSNSSTYRSQVIDLINGFRNIWGDCASPASCNWANNDGYDDDLGVTELAFIRCYEITGSGICLSDAENSFQAVYSRGWDSTFGGGLWWNANEKTGSNANKSSSANWTAVIAGYLIYKDTGNMLYKTDADNIYNWATSSSGLEATSTGQIYNDQQSGGPNTGLVSYNFGLAAGAAYMENDTTNSNAIGTYLINNVHQDTIGGYNILPNYGQSTNGFGAFNAMTFRWTAVANEAHGGMPSNFVAWADANLNQGWAVRNPDAMTWDDWIPDPPASTSPITPTTGLLATDCTPMLVGMWWFAPTAQ